MISPRIPGAQGPGQVPEPGFLDTAETSAQLSLHWESALHSSSAPRNTSWTPTGQGGAGTSAPCSARTTTTPWRCHEGPLLRWHPSPETPVPLGARRARPGAEHVPGDLRDRRGADRPRGRPAAVTGQTTTASSTENAGTPASNATDGNTGTRWSSAFSRPPVAPGRPRLHRRDRRVVLTWEAAYGTGYQIQTSTDGANWTTIYSTTTGTGGTQTLTVSGTGRYVRMYGTARATGYGYSLWEFQVYGSTGGGSRLRHRPTPRWARPPPPRPPRTPAPPPPPPSTATPAPAGPAPPPTRSGSRSTWAASADDLPDRA